MRPYSPYQGKTRDDGTDGRNELKIGNLRRIGRYNPGPSPELRRRAGVK